MTTDRRLFHLLGAAAGEALLGGSREPIAPDPRERQGFVHLSFAGQLAGTLAAHFDGVDRLVLVEAELDADDPDLRLERSRADARFPHLYRPLSCAELRRAWVLRRGTDGRWTLPTLAHDPADDSPPGLPLP